MLVLTVLSCLVAFLLVGLYAQFKWSNRHILRAAAKLPCPTALPVIGNALFFLGSVSSITKNIIRLTTKFKGLFCIWIGPVPVFAVADPTDVQTVLNTSTTLEKDDIYVFLKPYFGNGILTGPVPIWKKYRRILSPIFHPSNVERFLPIFNDVSKDLMTDLDQQVGKAIDPRDGIFNLAVDAVMRAIMGRNPMNVKTKKNIKYLIHEVGSMFINRLFKVHLHVEWIFSKLYHKEVTHCLGLLSECLDVIDKEMEDEAKLRETNPEEYLKTEPQRLGIKTMADSWYNNPHDGIEEHDWKDEVTTMIVAATDTVIAATSFLLITLANNPDKQEKIYAEIKEVMGDSDREITLADLNKMTYLGQAIMESMRIHGTFPVILRRATKDTKLSSGTLPAGSRIMLPLHAMGWNKDHFPEPEKFIPERFSTNNNELNDDGSKKHNYAFLPFSAGPRNCIGKLYGIFIMKTMITYILRKYKVTSDMKMTDIEYEIKVVMFSKNPVPMTFVPRSSR